MKLHLLLQACFLLIFPLLCHAVSRYSDGKCCNIAKEVDAFIPWEDGGPQTPLSEVVCEQVYNDTNAPAPNAYVAYRFCRNKCSKGRFGGWGLSDADKPSQWAASIVQFLLPSVIFSMNIPRRFVFVSPSAFQQNIIGDGRSWARSAIMLPISLIFVALDAIVWVILIMGMAGPMMVAGLHEGLLDYKILKALEKKERYKLRARFGNEPRNKSTAFGIYTLGQHPRTRWRR